MISFYRASTTAVLIACMASPSLAADSTATAREDVSTIRTEDLSSTDRLPGTTEFVRSVAEPAPVMLASRLASPMFASDKADVFAQRGYRGRGGSRGRNSGAAAAMFLGAAAAIAGTAVLIYANRPECSMSPAPGGCGYGAKVVGGSVLAAGLAGVIIGAVSWR